MVGCNWVHLVHMFRNPAHLVVACWGWVPPGCEARVWSTVVIKIVVWSFVVRFCQSVCLLLLSTLSLIVCKPVYLQSVPPWESAPRPLNRPDPLTGPCSLSLGTPPTPFRKCCICACRFQLVADAIFGRWLVAIGCILCICSITQHTLLLHVGGGGRRQGRSP